MPFTTEPLAIPDIKLITPKIFNDGRGFFMETYKQSDFKRIGIDEIFVQDNHSCSEKNTLRGLHYQIDPYAQGKLVRVLRGSILDVVVDIREKSPTYLQWTSATLSAENKQMLWVPVGFAHGFLTLENETEVFYKVTAEYSPEHEKGLCWNDPQLNIPWPVDHPVLSERDQAHPLL